MKLMKFRRLAAAILCAALVFTTCAEPISVNADDLGDNGNVIEVTSETVDLSSDSADAAADSTDIVDNTGDGSETTDNTDGQTENPIEETSKDTGSEGIAAEPENTENAAADTEADENIEEEAVEAILPELEDSVAATSYPKISAPDDYFTEDPVLKKNSKYDESTEYNIFKIPATCEEIPDGMFEGQTSITEIKFQSGSNLKKIGTSAFKGCTQLHVFNDSTVTEIGNSAFEGCTSLEQFFASHLKTIGDAAFKDCNSLGTFNVTNMSVSSIGEEAFSGCSSLTEMSFIDEDAIEQISKEAFKGTGLKRINLSGYDSLKEIGASAFEGCVNAENSITVPNVCESIGDRAFYGCKKIGDITINGTIEDENILIGKNAFTGCEKIGKVNIETSSDEYGIIIDEAAFDGCVKLTDVTIKAHILYMYNEAFSSCSALKNVTITGKDDNEKDNEVYIGGEDGTTGQLKGVFSATKALSRVTVTAKKITVLKDAFSYCGDYNKTTKVGTADVLFTCDITNIEDGGFKAAEGIKTFEIKPRRNYVGESAASIGKNGFEGATGLQSLIINAVNINIDEEAFTRCTSLATVKLSTAVNSDYNNIIIGVSAFSGCTGLGSPEFSGRNVIIGDSAFSGCYDSATNKGLLNIYINAAETTEIGKNAFKDIQSLKTFNAYGYPNSSDNGKCIIIRESAFEGCKALASTSSTAPLRFSHYSSDDDEEIIIEDKAFKNSGVYSVELPAKIGSLGKNVFEGCTNLVAIQLPLRITDSVDNYGNQMLPSGTFSDCSKLKTVNFETETDDTIGKSEIVRIGMYAFSNCTSLTAIEFPKSVKYIDDHALTGCNALKTVTFKYEIKYNGKDKTSGPDEDDGDITAMRISEFAFPTQKLTVKGYEGYVKTFAEVHGHTFELLSPAYKISFSKNLTGAYDCSYLPANPKQGDTVTLYFKHKTYEGNVSYLYDLSGCVGIDSKNITYVNTTDKGIVFTFKMKDSDVTIDGTVYKKSELLPDDNNYTITFSEGSLADGKLYEDKAGKKKKFTITGKKTIPEWLWAYSSSSAECVAVTPTGYIVTQKVTNGTDIKAVSVMDKTKIASFRVIVSSPTQVYKIEFDEDTLDDIHETLGAKIDTYEYTQNQFIPDKPADPEEVNKNPEVEYPVITFRKSEASNNEISFKVKIKMTDDAGDECASFYTKWDVIDPTIAKVASSATYDDTNTITLLKGKEGETAITVTATSSQNSGKVVAENKIIVRLVDTTPRLTDDYFTVNSMSTVGTSFDIFTSYGDEIDTAAGLQMVYYDKAERSYNEITSVGSSQLFTFTPGDSENTTNGDIKYSFTISCANTKAQTIKYPTGMYIKGQYKESTPKRKINFYIPVSYVKIINNIPKPKFKKTGFINTFYNAESYEYYIDNYYDYTKPADEHDPEAEYFCQLEKDGKIKSAAQYHLANWNNLTAGRIVFKQDIADKIAAIELRSLEVEAGGYGDDLFDEYYEVAEVDDSGAYNDEDYDGVSFTIQRREGSKDIKDPETGKNVLSGYVIITYEGFPDAPYKMKVTLTNKSVAPKYKLTPSSAALYEKVEDQEFELELLDSFKNPVSLEEDTEAEDDTITLNNSSGSNWKTPEIADGKIKLELDGCPYSATSKAVMNVTQPTWSGRVAYTFTLTKHSGANKAAPVFESKTIKYNTNNGLDVSTSIKLNQAGVKFTSTEAREIVSHKYKEDSTQAEIADQIIENMKFDLGDDGKVLTLTLKGKTNDNYDNWEYNGKFITGSYSFTLTPELEYGDGEEFGSKPAAFTVFVVGTRPNVKLKKSTLSFNSYYGVPGKEIAKTAITLTGLPKDTVIEEFNTDEADITYTAKSIPMETSEGKFVAKDDSNLVIEFCSEDTDDDGTKDTMFAKAYLEDDAARYAINGTYTITNLKAVTADEEEFCLNKVKLTVKGTNKPVAAKWTLKGTLNPIIRSQGIALTAKLSNISADSCVDPDTITVTGPDGKESEYFEVKPVMDTKNPDKVVPNKFMLYLKEDFNDSEFTGNKKYKIKLKYESEAIGKITDPTVYTITVKQTFPNITGKYLLNADDEVFDGFIQADNEECFEKSKIAEYCKKNAKTDLKVYAAADSKYRTFRVYVGNSKAMQESDLAQNGIIISKTNKDAIRRAFTITNVEQVPVIDEKNPDIKYYEWYADVTCENSALLKLGTKIPIVFETVWKDQVKNTTGPRFTLNLTVKK